jgi:hypothetical protein
MFAWSKMWSTGVMQGFNHLLCGRHDVANSVFAARAQHLGQQLVVRAHADAHHRSNQSDLDHLRVGPW